MKLRTKLLLPVLLLISLLCASFYFVWLPQEVEKSRLDDIETTQLALKSITEALIPPLLESNYINIFEFLDSLMTYDNEWVDLELFTNQDQQIYPLIGQLPKKTNTHLQKINRKISFLEQDLGYLILTIDSSKRMRERENEFHQLVLNFIILLAVFTFILISIINFFIRSPLAKLAKAVDKMASGDFEQTLPKVQDDEVGEITVAFSHMRDEIQKGQSKLNQLIKVADDANQAKSVFLSRMSHELRTPLNAVIGYSQVLKNSGATQQDIHRFANEIYMAGQHLLRLVNDILDIVSIEQHRMSISLTSCQLSEVIPRCISLVQQAAAEEKIKLIYKPTELSVTADNMRLTQVLINLLTNAIKYNQQDGNVTVETRKINPQMVEICVSDSGIGIDAKDLKRIFEPFTRLDYAEKNQISGSGIGLSLSKSLIEQMQGNISIESQLNQGSTFSIILPLAKTPL